MMMVRGALVVLMLVTLAACGRSSISEVGITDVSVGLSSQSGGPLTPEQVSAALERFDFELIYLAEQPVCGQREACVWWAEGALPEVLLDQVERYQDQQLKVVRVIRVLDSPEPPAELAPRR